MRYMLKENGDIVRVFVDGETEEAIETDQEDVQEEALEFAPSRYKWGYREAKQRLQQRHVDKTMTLNLLVDVLVNSRQNGNEVRFLLQVTQIFAKQPLRCSELSSWPSRWQCLAGFRSMATTSFLA